MLRIEELLGMRPIHELKLIVEESTSTSFTEAYLSQNVMADHVIWYGDSKVLLGKDGLKTACSLLTDSSSEAVADDKIKLNSAIRGKLGVSVGDSITILKNESIPRVRIVSFVPFKECLKDLESVNLFEAYLRPYFKDAFRPVHTGDVFKIALHSEYIQFKITNIDPSPFGIVGPETIIKCHKGAQLIKKTKILKSTKVPSASVTVPGPIMGVSSAVLLAGGLTQSLPVETEGLNTEQNKGPTKFQLTKPETLNTIPTSLPGSGCQDPNLTKVLVGDSRKKSKTFVQKMEANISEAFSLPVQLQTSRKPVQLVSPMVDQTTAAQCDRSTQDTEDETRSQTSVVPIVPRKEPKPDLGLVPVRILRTRAIKAAAKKEAKEGPYKRQRKIQSKEKSNNSGQQITHEPAIDESQEDVGSSSANESSYSRNVSVTTSNVGISSRQKIVVKGVDKKYLALVREGQAQCSHCLRQAFYYCCEKTAYCSFECQKIEWLEQHEHHCRRF